MTSIEITHPKVVIVEGKEDQAFFQAFASDMKLEIQIMTSDGKTLLGSYLKALKNTRGFEKVESLGIIRDADQDAQSAFRSVCSALAAAKLPQPEYPLKPSGASPQTIVMILPDGENPGTLEDLCLRAVVEDKAIKCVEEYFKCLKKVGCEPKNLSKAKIQAFLASRPNAGLRLGEAAKAGYWLFDGLVFNHVRDFFQKI